MKLVFLFPLLLCSCSAVEKIQRNSNDITTHAQESKAHFEGIISAASAVPPRLEEISQRSHQGILEQTAIIEKAQGVIEATSGVKDIVPWWANTLEIVMISLAVIAILILLWYTGVGTAIRKILGLIPEHKQDQAKLLDEALSGKTDIREAIAFMRAKDPMLDSAFKKRKESASDAQLQTDSTTTT